VYVNTHIRVVNCQLGNNKLPHSHQVARMALWAEVGSVIVSPVCVGRVEVHRHLDASSVCADSSPCHLGKEGRYLCGCDEAQLRVFLSQPSPLYAQESQITVSTLPILWHEVSWFGVVFPLLRPTKTPLWPFSPLSKRGTCRSILAVPDLPVLP